VLEPEPEPPPAPDPLLDPELPDVLLPAPPPVPEVPEEVPPPPAPVEPPDPPAEQFPVLLSANAAGAAIRKATRRRSPPSQNDLSFKVFLLYEHQKIG